MMMEIENQYATRSLPVVAFLFAREASFIRIDRRGNIVYFIFEKCDDIVTDYFSGGTVIASSFWAAIQQAKDLIYSGDQQLY